MLGDKTCAFVISNHCCFSFLLYFDATVAVLGRMFSKRYLFCLQMLRDALVGQGRGNSSQADPFPSHRPSLCLSTVLSPFLGEPGKLPSFRARHLAAWVQAGLTAVQNTAQVHDSHSPCLFSVDGFPGLQTSTGKTLLQPPGAQHWGSTLQGALWFPLASLDFFSSSSSL